MRVKVVFDSAYGNTDQLARAIGRVLTAEIGSVSAEGAVGPGELDLLVVGSPTQAGRPTAAVHNWLNAMPPAALQGIRVAAFDTRMAREDQGLGLRLLMGVIGYAAPRIAEALQGKGGLLVAPPEGFIVIDREGPLKPGELERAGRWAQDLQRHVAR